MTETSLAPQDANGRMPFAALPWRRTPFDGEDPGPVTAGLEPPVVTAARFVHLMEIVSHMADRIAYLELRIDEYDIPDYRELEPEPGESFRYFYPIDHGVTP
jgi:hypothetical protein